MALATTNLQTRNPLFERDLFHYTLENFIAPELSPESRAVLVSLARTCRAFSELSLDRLWSKLGSLDPLIRCFSTELNAERAKTPPSPTEWAIIHRYSYRIKELRIFVVYEFSMLFLKATSLHPGLLVPNLRVLSWHTCISPDEGSPALSIVFVQQLLNPSLVSLNVTLIDQEDGTLQSFLANYAFLCPNLKSVTVNLGCMQMSRTAVQALSRSITHHTHLERLKLSTPVDHVALTHIAMSPKLKELSLVLHPERSNLHQVRIPSNTIPFPNVMDLKLQVWNLHFVTTLLRTEDQMFRSVVICRRYRPTIKAAFSLFAILASQQRARSLQSITLISDFLDVQSRRFPPPELDDLRHLILDLGHWFSLDDDDLVSLARNWPSLQTLQLGCGERVYEYPWRSTKYITFKGLLSLLGCCPDLYDLSLPLDARQVPVDTGDVVCNPALTLLRLLEPPIDNVRSVRDILARHFPSVREVIISFDQSSEDGDAEYALYVELWDEVNILLENTHASHHDDSES